MNENHPYFKEAQKRAGLVVGGKWTLNRVLDVGGMAAVYEATHRNGNRVAMKVLHNIYAKSEQVRQRFLREGYLANKVGHPGAVSIQDDDVLEDGTPFLVMELLEGESLESRLRSNGPLPPAEVLFIADSVLGVLASAHDQNLIHRDIKPANIYLTMRGTVKVLDFGLARLRDETATMSLTRTGMVIGTATFMPPEQARGKRDMVDHRSDIWAVGATMFYALTRCYVHQRDTPAERLIAAMSEPAPALASVSRTTPAMVSEIVDRSLAFQRQDRYQSATEMKAAIRDAYRLLEGQPLTSGQSGASWSAVPASAGHVTGTDDVHVSVVFEDAPTGDSIMVEFEDLENDDVAPERYRLRRRTAAPDSEEDDLSEVSVVEDVDGPSSKR